MEGLMIILVLTSFVLASFVGGADSRPRIDDEPRRAI